MSRRTRLAAVSCALALSTATAAQAAKPQIQLLERPAARFQQAIDTHTLEAKYRALSARAAKLDVEPANNMLATRKASPIELSAAVATLRERVEKAERIERRKPDFGPVAGVSQATLDTIAACESGGDPTAVDSSGTYFGKYQFDTGTWASMGGSGSPAAASEAEQDYRASLLYSQAGSSPWPVCGV